MMSSRSVCKYSLAAYAALAAFRLLEPSEARAQSRECDLSGPLTAVLPNSPTTYALQPSTLVESGPFLSQPRTPTTISAQIAFSPAAQPTPPWLLAPILETMGNCEGPPTFGTVGDGGQATTDFGPCGVIQDSFSVAAIGAAYKITHTLSGNLNLANVPALNATQVVSRNATITLGAQSGSGTVDILAGTLVLCHGTFSANYTIQNPSSVKFPWPCNIQSPFNAVSGTAFVGTVVRTQPISSPALPGPGWLIGLAMLLFPAGVWGMRRLPRSLFHPAARG